MARFVQLTNANLEQHNEPILLNFDRVLSVYRDASGEYTQIFVPEQGNWMVKETVEQIAVAVEAAKPRTTRKRNGGE